jgi:LysM repeat protein
MLSRKIAPFIGLAMMFLLAGCFRQAEETFEPIDSQSSGGQPITVEPSEAAEETDIPVLVIDPNASQEPTQEEEPTQAEEATATDEQEVAVVATNEPEEAEASPTLRVIDPTASNETVLASSTPNVPPTATEAQVFITPAVNVEAVIPTANPSEAVEQATLQATPTNEGDEAVVLGDCEYEVQSGDTLFRIALDNEVSLADLLEANNLSEGEIIQPSQILIIPNCDAPEVVETEATGTEELTECDYIVQTGDTLFEIALDNEVALEDLLELNELTEASIIQPEQVLRLPDCEEDESSEGMGSGVSTATPSGDVVHMVVSGDTLLSIARRYGVTVNEIIQANNIPNPNSLTVGQQLVIPQD